MEKMKVEIWSDVVCPFCYIGKRKFEKAMGEFPFADQIEIEYKSFQLNPDMKTDPTLSQHEALAAHKGITVDHARQMAEQVTDVAKQVGLHFDFDRAVPANTLNAHRLLHLAKKEGRQQEAKELLLKAYFTNGENIDAEETLLNVAGEIGTDQEEVRKMLNGKDFFDEVRLDIYEAQQLGIRGVPFFAFDRKYAVSGAQESKVFLQTLEKSFSEWQSNQTHEMKISEGESCDADGNCN